MPATIIASALLACASPLALDGDTIKCADGVRLRLSGIDSPELPGHCRKGRDCAPGDPYKAKAALAAIIANGMTYRAIKLDVYGRTVAMVYAGSVNANCSQFATGNARYVAKWDEKKMVAKECGL